MERSFKHMIDEAKYLIKTIEFCNDRGYLSEQQKGIGFDKSHVPSLQKNLDIIKKEIEVRIKEIKDKKGEAHASPVPGTDRNMSRLHM